MKNHVQQHNAAMCAATTRNATPQHGTAATPQRSEAQSGGGAGLSGLAPKVFAALMSIVLVVGLMPGLSISQAAYAAQDETSVESSAADESVVTDGNATSDQFIVGEENTNPDDPAVVGEEVINSESIATVESVTADTVSNVIASQDEATPIARLAPIASQDEAAPIARLAPIASTTLAASADASIAPIADADLPPNVRLRATWNIGADPDHEDALTASIYYDSVQSIAYFVIAGEGDAKTFASAEEIPWRGDDAEHINYVIFEEGPEITCLDYWFDDFIGLVENPVIPETVTSLDSTFYGCTSITEAPSIPAGVTNLNSTFYGCTALKTLPEGFAIPEGATTENTFYVGEPYSSDNLRWTHCSEQDYEVLSTYNWEADNRCLSANLLGSWYIGSPETADVTATITNDGELMISGTGDVMHYASFDDIPWYAQGFAEDITSVTFKDSVTPIYLDYWFYGCANLAVAPEIPDSVLSMVSTFEYCTSMTLPADYTLPYKLVDMSATFMECSSLTLPAGFTIPDSVISLVETFYDCTSLELPEDFTLPSQVIFLDYAFAWSGITSVPANFVIPDTVTSASHMFYYCMALTTIGEGFTIGANVATIEMMFNYCSVLEALPAGFTIPDSVTNMSRAFERCFALTELPAGFTIGAGVEDMSYAFYYCSHLEALPAGFAIPDSVVDMSHAFERCSVLEGLPAGFTIGANVEDMSCAFYNCAGITELPAGFAFPENAETTQAFYVGGPYSADDPLVTLCDASDFTALSAYDWASDSRKLVSDKNKVAFAVYSADDNSLTFYCDTAPDVGDTYNGKTVTAVYTGFDTQSYDQNSVPWSDVRDAITTVATDDSFADVQPISCAFWFSQFSSCTGMNLTYLDTSAVTDMTRMFYNCSSLASLDVTGFNTSAVTNMSFMFDYCSSLTALDVTNFDTSAVTNMSYLFYNCSALTALDVTNFDTSTATNMSAMFYNCAALTALDVTNFDTSAVTDMSYMFYGCSALTSLDVSGFDTSAVRNMSAMFYGCSALTALDVTNFDTSAVTDMSYLFYDCSTPGTFDVSNFDTSSVKNMRSMFYDCSGLTTLDLSNFDTSSVTNMAYMFYRCSALTTLDLSNFDTSAVTNMAYMFYYCSALTSLDVSSFNTASVTSYSYFLIGAFALDTLSIGDNFDLFVKSSSRLTEPQKWYDAAGEPVANYLIGVNTAGTYYTSVHTALTKDMFNVDTSYGIYDGTTPVIKTIASDLVEGVDYTVEYEGNDRAGEATIIIRGAGNYTGELIYAFKILNYFEDVWPKSDDNEWYFDAVYGMVDLGAITGYSETIFGVGDSMTRAQLVTIMWRYCDPDDYEHYDEATAKNTTDLPDVADGTYYTGAVNWAVEKGVVTGNLQPDGTYTFNPDDPVTFEQLATIVARYCLGGIEAAADYPTASLDNGAFTDKDAVEDFARGSMAWAVANGVITGNDNHDGTWTLSPLEDVARERATTVLYRTIEGGLL